ncbi:MAG: hypothetical protein LBI29_00215, partial [Rickettsiales bacterium]|nr:hypothetical protein [Rickettsiales bacterium]
LNLFNGIFGHLLNLAEAITHRDLNRDGRIANRPLGERRLADFNRHPRHTQNIHRENQRERKRVRDSLPDAGEIPGDVRGVQGRQDVQGVWSEGGVTGNETASPPSRKVTPAEWVEQNNSQAESDGKDFSNPLMAQLAAFKKSNAQNTPATPGPPLNNESSGKLKKHSQGRSGPS